MIGVWAALFIAFLTVYVYLSVKQSKVIFLMICMQFTQSVMFIGVFLTTTCISLNYIVAMRNYQNYEYHRHKGKVIFIFIVYGGAGIFSTIASIVATVNFLAFYMDTLFHAAKPGKSALGYFIESADMSTLNFASFVFVLVVFNAPYLIYFGMNSLFPPHDCFECFNRLGNKRYSIFQYTQ